MKAKYLLSIVLSSMVMISCQGNTPDKDNRRDIKQSSEIVERLDSIGEKIGSIVNAVTQKDGSIVLTDDMGNTITKDTEGNITILTKDGVVILIDYSVNEDASAAKDKWYNSKWSGMRYKVGYAEMDEFHEFLNRLKMYGFQIEKRTYSKDSIVTYIVDGNLYKMGLKTTTCSIQKTETQTEYTDNRIYNLVQHIVSPDYVEKQGTIYRYEVIVSEEDSHYYFHVIYAGQNICDYYVSQDSVLIEVKNYQNIDTQERLLSRSDTTIYYNYHRLNDTQLAIHNNSESYIFKETTDGTKPYLSMYDLNDQKIAEFELSSL